MTKSHKPKYEIQYEYICLNCNAVYSEAVVPPNCNKCNNQSFHKKAVKETVSLLGFAPARLLNPFKTVEHSVKVTNPSRAEMLLAAPQGTLSLFRSGSALLGTLSLFRFGTDSQDSWSR